VATVSPVHKVRGFLRSSETMAVLTVIFIAFMNLIENFINFLYLYKTHVAPSPVAPLIGLFGATMTLWKTVLYWAQEYYCNYCAVGHNDLFNLIVLWMIPNGYNNISPNYLSFH
jgi:hypothetical protein